MASEGIELHHICGMLRATIFCGVFMKTYKRVQGSRGLGAIGMCID